MKQLCLFRSFDQCSLTLHLKKFVRKNICLVITDNSRVMLSFRTTGNRITLRLHRIFLSAELDVLDELIEYVNNKRTKTPLINNFINNNHFRIPKKPPRKELCIHQGKNFNLQEMYNRINNEYFDDRIASSITWSRRRPKRSVAKRTLGSYSQDSDLIRISTVLDSSNVPMYFLEFVVYHEMLHADQKNSPSDRKRAVHDTEFKRREKLFRYYDRAVSWEKKRWG